VNTATGDTSVRPLSVEQLYCSADLPGVAFSTTAESQPIGLVGQARAGRSDQVRNASAIAANEATLPQI
jgi:hypothetical protein